MVTQKEFLNKFESLTSNLQTQIEFSRESNLDLFLEGKGGIGEYLGSLVSGKKGTGSGGSGFDLSDGESADEVKLACLVQSSKCKDCDAKVLFWYAECNYCGSSNLKRLNDSRWGIDATAGVKYKDELDKYILQVIKPKEYDADCKTFIYEYYVVDSKDPYFSEYLVNQYNNGKKSNCNYLPYSYDFYLSNPVKLIELEFTVNENGNRYKVNYWNLEHSEACDIPLSVLRKSELIILLESEGIYYKDNWNLAKFITAVETQFRGNPKNYLTLRNKSHGKDRGITNRKLIKKQNS